MVSVRWGAWLGKIMADGPLKDLVVDGIIGGVGGVIVFLPNILILYLFISLMEDSGYMARAAFIMDKIMHKIGLHGKSFIPLVMGFRMQRTGHYGHAYHREQKQPVDYHSDKPLHVVQRTAAGLCAVGRRLLPGPCRYGAVLPLSVGYRSGCHYGEIAAKIPFPER